MNQFHNILVTGGAGYVGSALVPKLIERGYRVRVLDLFIYGDHVLDSVKAHPRLELIKGDIRDQSLLRHAMVDCDGVLHLACISNDPSFQLNPALSKSINYDAFRPLVSIAKEGGVRRFVYASTASVYGVSDAPEVTEDHPFVPLTDYNKYKGLCEPILLEYRSADFVPVIIRPSTVCGFAPRQRLDLSVNILTNHAVNTRQIKVFGGSQMRPNIHIADVVDLYLLLFEVDDDPIAGQAFNAGWQNLTVDQMAGSVKKVVEMEMRMPDIDVVHTPSDDLRSYHISSEKIRRVLGFVPRRTVEDAVRDLCDAFRRGLLPNSMTDARYSNIRRMQQVNLQ